MWHTPQHSNDDGNLLSLPAHMFHEMSFKAHCSLYTQQKKKKKKELCVFFPVKPRIKNSPNCAMKDVSFRTKRSSAELWKHLKSRNTETSRASRTQCQTQTSLCWIHFISFPCLPQTVNLAKVTGGTNRPPNCRSDMSGCSGSSPFAACSSPFAACSYAIGAVVSFSGVEKRTCDGGSVITRPRYANRGGSADLAKRLSVSHLNPSFPRLNIHRVALRRRWNGLIVHGGGGGGGSSALCTY